MSVKVSRHEGIIILLSCMSCVYVYNMDAEWWGVCMVTVCMCCNVYDMDAVCVN